MKHKKINKNYIAVSEVLGTILLLGISVTVFSAVYATFLSVPESPSTPAVTIIGSIEDNDLIFEHRGGDKINLDSEIIIIPDGGTSERYIIDDLIEDEYKNQGWNIGERIIFPLDTFPAYERFSQVEVIIVDRNSRSIIMMGNVQEPKVANIKISMNIPETEPDISEVFIFSVIIDNTGPCEAEGIEIKIDYPASLTITSHSYSTAYTGIFNEATGFLTIESLPKDETVILDIEATIDMSTKSVPTQLVMVLDGSGSIIPSDWDMMRTGIAEALEDSDVFPHDGSVELTIVQFGGSDNQQPNARLELGGPVEITKFPGVEGYFGDIADQIRVIPQMNGWTPMACGLALAADVLVSTPNYYTHKHVVNIVTDGEANAVYNIEDGDYKMEVGSGGDYVNGKTSAIIARDYLRDVLNDDDEIDVEGVGITLEYINWLKDEIVWPDGYLAPPFNGPGWIRPVADYEEFKNTLKENFNFIFNQFELSVELTDTLFLDTNPNDNYVFEIITPQTQ